MIDKISYELVKYISQNVSFVDKWAGLVRPLRKKVQTADKVFPVAINTPTNCDLSDYMALVPDRDKKSIVYVEMITQPTIDTDKSYKFMSAQLRLVVWYNLDLITSGSYISEDVLADQILDWIPRRLPDASFIGVKQVHFLITGLVYGTDIVSQYTYNEIKTQFATHPYGIFGVNLDVWYVSTHCQTPVDVSGTCITGKGGVTISDLYPATNYAMPDGEYLSTPEGEFMVEET